MAGRSSKGGNSLPGAEFHLPGVHNLLAAASMTQLQ